MRKTDTKGDSVFVWGKEDGLERQVKSFAVGVYGKQESLDLAWAAFGDALRKAEERANPVGLGNRHHCEFRVFQKPEMIDVPPNHVQHPIFSAPANWDPLADFIEGHVPCPNYLVMQEMYVGKQKCLRGSCQCGAGIRTLDIDETQQNHYLPAPKADGMPNGPLKEKVLDPDVKWQEVVEHVFPRLPVDLAESSGSCVDGKDGGSVAEIPDGGNNVYVVATNATSVKFGPVGAFAPENGKIEVPADHRYWILSLRVNREDPLALYLHYLQAGFREGLIEAQEKDPEFGPLRIAVKRLSGGYSDAETELHLARKFSTDVARSTMHEVRRCYIDDLGLLARAQDGRTLICVPQGGKVEYQGEKMPYRKYFLRLAHEDVVGACHAGPTQTHRHLLERGVWWGSMWNQTQAHCKACLPCAIASARGEAHVPRGAERHVGIFRVLHVDHVGPLKTDDGYRYILTIRDHTSLFTWFLPVKTKKTKEASQAILEVACQIGFPVLIRTDQGFGEVGDESLGAHLRTYGILHVPTMPYNPTGNTVAESVHKPLRRFLEKFCTRAEWVKFLPFICWSTRTMVFDALGGRSPYEIVYGRKPRFAFEQELRTAFGGNNDTEKYLEDSGKFQQEMIEAMKLSRAENGRKRTHIGPSLSLQVGDLCVVANKQRRKENMEPRNWPALFRVKSSHLRGVTLVDLHGKDATGFASGMLPRHMIGKVADKEQADELLRELGPNEIPTTDQMLGDMARAFAKSAVAQAPGMSDES